MGRRETLAGPPFPSARPTTASGTNFSRLLRGRRARSSCACSTTTAPRRASTCPRSTPSAGTATCPTRRRASATASGSTGPATPSTGLRCNPAKLLLDPYAKAVEGEVDWDAAAVRLPLRRPRRRPQRRRQRRRTCPRRVVTSPFFDWGNDRPPRTPWHETVIYEVHVKGFTAAPSRASPRSCAAPTPAWPTRRRSTTSARSASPPSSCCRCTSSSTTHHLVERGLRNYWGYNSIGFFAPHNDYARPGPAGRAGAGVQADGARRCTRPASR